VGEADVIYSVLAGTSIDTLKSSLISKYYVRAMPNISAKFQSQQLDYGDIERRDSAISLLF